MIPFCMSSANPAPVKVAPNTTVCAKDACNQKLPIGTAGDVDGAAEDIGEEQDEHDRRNQDEHQHLRNSLDLYQVSLGQHRRIGQEVEKSVS